MLSRRILLALVVSVCAATPAFAAFTPSAGYEAVELYSSAGTFTTCGGLSLYGGSLYFGQFAEVKSLDLSTGTDAVVGTIPSNAGNSLVEVNPADGSVCTAYGTSYAAPYIHKMGTVDAGGFTEQLAMGGIYDAAVNSAGDLYITANPDVDGDDTPDGSGVFRYDWSDGSTVKIATIGGSTSGLTFDADDNLYCSAYDENQVAKFTAAQVVSGGLTLADAAGTLDLAGPGFLTFDDAGNLFATNLDAMWTTHVGLYDFAANTKLAEVGVGGGKMVVSGNTLYTIDTDWGTYSSTIQAVTAVPEPGTLLLICFAAMAALLARQRR